ncbi:YrhK family protein [Vibrio aestuarianus]|uniref:YrhK family protein n=1 Tax=Vibrio aestuarianus TaxID=28171 RepID=UPI00237CF1B9|nr:YrhK family protein [Vibrio aestuarianus]MDE1251074.1 YrhK family protein [Vibrio aestuarianus]MDE1351269.1 YrhK family protein [Vibrio aestuarianus]
MPHFFTNRKRIHNLTVGNADTRSQFKWETLNAVLYKFGGLFFLVGSVLSFPTFQAYSVLGQWIFFTGSMFYLIVNVHDLFDVHRYWQGKNCNHPRKRLEYSAAYIYFVGTLLFVMGRVVVFVDNNYSAHSALMFTIGSALFVIGASVNILADTKNSVATEGQLTNLTAITFIVGSVLFAVGSFPGLWEGGVPTEVTQLSSYLSWQFLIGSLLFFFGGVFNYWRAYHFIQRSLGTKA